MKYFTVEFENGENYVYSEDRLSDILDLEELIKVDEISEQEYNSRSRIEKSYYDEDMGEAWLKEQDELYWLQIRAYKLFYTLRQGFIFVCFLNTLYTP